MSAQCLVFLIKKGICFIIKILIKTRIEAKKIHCVLEMNQWQWLKPYTEFNTEKEQSQKKIRTKMEKRYPD